MPLTRDFKETIRAEAQSDPELRVLLLKETINEFLSGDLKAAKGMLRYYIHATVGFEGLGRELSKSPKSLMRMLGPTGNPQASNLFAIFHYLQEKESVHLEVKAQPTRKRPQGAARKSAPKAKKTGKTRPASTSR